MHKINSLQRSFLYRVFGFTLRLWLFQQTLKPDQIGKEATSDEIKKDFNRISCPNCKWRPVSSSRWFCGNCDYPEYFYEGCGATWNTFATRGRCPGCNHQWIWTSCLRCAGWARHEEWYQKDDG